MALINFDYPSDHSGQNMNRLLGRLMMVRVIVPMMMRVMILVMVSNDDEDGAG